jgi:arylsulfatase
MNLLDAQRVKWEAPQPLPPGRHTVVFDFTLNPQGPIPFGHGGTGVLQVNGQEVARQAMAHTIPFTFAWDETFDVGMDTGTPVDDRDYQVPFVFSGRIGRITVDLGDGTVNEASINRFLAEMAARARDAERPAPGAAPTAPRN